MKTGDTLTDTASDESVITQIQPAPMSVPRVLLVDDDELVIERMRDLVTRRRVTR